MLPQRPLLLLLLVLALARLPPAVPVHLTVREVEDALRHLQQPVQGHRRHRVSSGVSSGVPSPPSPMRDTAIEAAREHWREGHWRECANIFADLLELYPGDPKLVKYLHRAYAQLYPQGPKARKPVNPTMEMFEAAVERLLGPRGGVELPDGRTLRAEALDGHGGSVAPLYVIRGFLAPDEVAVLRRHAAQRMAAYEEDD